MDEGEEEEEVDKEYENDKDIVEDVENTNEDDEEILF